MNFDILTEDEETKKTITTHFLNRLRRIKTEYLHQKEMVEMKIGPACTLLARVRILRNPFLG